MELLLKNRGPLCSIEGSYVVNEFVLVRPSVPQPTQAPGSLQDLLNISIMEGPKLRMPTREIYHEFSKIFQADFVMYVDISHLLAEETCFLRFTVRWNQDFHQQWQQVAWRTWAGDILVYVFLFFLLHTHRCKICDNSLYGSILNISVWCKSRLGKGSINPSNFRIESKLRDSLLLYAEGGALELRFGRGP